MIKCIGDYHTHSEYSHGRGTIKGNIEQAIAKGLQELAITDHGPRAWNFIRLGVRDEEELLGIRDKINRLQLEYPKIKLYSGVEANIINRDGEIDLPNSILDQLDIIAVGFHLLIYPPNLTSLKDIIVNNRIIYKYFPDKREEIRYFNTEIIIKTVQKNKIDFITHPGYGIDIDTYELAKVCAEEDTYLEINARHVKELENYIKVAAKTDVKFIINSDAHSPIEIGEFSDALRIVKKLNIPLERIVNISA